MKVSPWLLGLLAALLLFSIVVVVVPKISLRGFVREGFKLGLDISGGTHIVLEADLSVLQPGESAEDALRGAMEIIRRRIDAYGVTEPVVQRQPGGNRIIVQLPGVKDVDEAVRLIGKAAFLDFRELSPENILTTPQGTFLVWQEEKERFLFSTTNGQIADELNRGSIPDNLKEQLSFLGYPLVGEASVTRLKDNEWLIAGGVEFILRREEDKLNIYTKEIRFPLDKAHFRLYQGLTQEGKIAWLPAKGVLNGQEPYLIGEYLKKRTFVGLEPTTNAPLVHFEWNEDGAKLFEQITSRLIGKPLGIFLDDELISAPTVRAVIKESGVIEGLSLDEARLLSIQLNAGALPVPLKTVQQQDVSAILGADALKKSLRAGVVGLGLLLLFMIAYYRLPGFVAVLALLFYGFLVLAIFKLFPVTLTLAGIAGFLVSLGMAVDANVLIFERLKEELLKGKTLGAAIEHGFSRAWTAIRDSNITTFIACGVLYWFGSELGAAPVMGFALTLFIGVAISMFTAIMVTRNLLRLLLATPLRAKTSWFRV